MENLDMFIDNKKPKERCEGCKYCKRIYANGGWSFYACYHEPYHGKWVAEIKDCPKQEDIEKENYDGRKMFEMSTL